jgi:AraC-like DNA-binding protein
MNHNASIEESFGFSIINLLEASYRRLDIQNDKRSHWIISCVKQGRVVMRIGGEVYEVSEGEVMIHPPFAEFSESNSSSGVHLVLFLDITLSDHLDLFRIYPVSPVVKLSDMPAFDGQFQELLGYWKQYEAPFIKIQFYAGLLQLLNMIILSWKEAGCLARPQPLHSTEDRFMEVIHYMNEHIDEKLSRDELAALLHLHPNYFDKLFRKHFQQTPMHMLRSLRLRKAKSMLEATSSTLEQIASSCGLGDAAYFTRSFKGEYHETPGQYRKRMQNMRSIYGSYEPLPE